jgi:hypothetical protein
VHAEHQHACIGLGAQDALDHLQAAGVGHRQVGDHDVRQLLPEPRIGLLRRLRFRYHGNPLLLLEQMAVAGAHDRMIVGEQQADDRGVAHGAGNGSCT